MTGLYLARRLSRSGGVSRRVYNNPFYHRLQQFSPAPLDLSREMSLRLSHQGTKLSNWGLLFNYICPAARCGGVSLGVFFAPWLAPPLLWWGLSSAGFFFRTFHTFLTFYSRHSLSSRRVYPCEGREGAGIIGATSSGNFLFHANEMR